MSENLYEDIRLIDAEAQGDRLVICFNEQDQEYRAFLETLEGMNLAQ